MEKSKINIRQTTIEITQIAVCAALLCVLSPLSIPTAFNIAFTLQVLAVILIALILKPLQALAAQVIYTIIGIIGLPVFAGYQSGFGAIMGPTGGFIIGFGKLLCRHRLRHFRRSQSGSHHRSDRPRTAP